MYMYSLPEIRRLLSLRFQRILREKDTRKLKRNTTIAYISKSNKQKKDYCH